MCGAICASSSWTAACSMRPGWCAFASSTSPFCPPAQNIPPRLTTRSGRRRARRWWSPAATCRPKLQQRVSVPVELAMRYQNPSIPDAVRSLAQKGVNEVLLIPLFPHYAMSSFETAVERVKEVVATLAPQMRLQVQPPFLRGARITLPRWWAARRSTSNGATIICCSVSTACRSGTCANPIPPAAIVWRRRTVARRPARRTPRATARSASRPWPPSSSKPACPRASTRSLSSPGWGEIPGLSLTRTLSFPGWRRTASGKLLVMCPAFVPTAWRRWKKSACAAGRRSWQRAATEFALIPCLNEHPLWLEALEKMVDRFIPAIGQVQPGSKPLR